MFSTKSHTIVYAQLNSLITSANTRNMFKRHLLNPLHKYFYRMFLIMPSTKYAQTFRSSKQKRNQYQKIHERRRLTQCFCFNLSFAQKCISVKRFDIVSQVTMKVRKVAKIRNRYNQVPHLTQDTNGKVTNSQKTPQTRAKRSALSQQVTTKHI